LAISRVEDGAGAARAGSEPGDAGGGVTANRRTNGPIETFVEHAPGEYLANLRSLPVEEIEGTDSHSMVDVVAQHASGDYCLVMARASRPS
jgi:hypothetical protein